MRTLRGLGLSLLLVLASAAGALALPPEPLPDAVAPTGAAPDGGDYAPLDRPGPALQVDGDALRQSLRCSGDLRGARRNPVLLVPGTNLSPDANFSWNYVRALDELGWPHCSVTLPGDSLRDIQVAAEHVVFAIRDMAARSGRRVDVVGHSQGGMVPRWALRFWPDTRPLVENLVGMAPSNHGTVLTDVTCRSSCPAAYWQQASTSAFMAALNSGAETFAGIDYTVIFTRLDQIVVPNVDGTASSLSTGAGDIRNIAVQDICPASTAEHLTIGTSDPVAHALVIDALTHPGPAQPGRVFRGVCSQVTQRGTVTATFPLELAGAGAYIAASAVAAEQVPAEPPLAPYVTAGR